ncbi:hypothetical protein ACPVPU_07430 [Sphingomonas sp. CJ99]
MSAPDRQAERLRAARELFERSLADQVPMRVAKQLLREERRQRFAAALSEPSSPLPASPLCGTEAPALPTIHPTDWDAPWHQR